MRTLKKWTHGPLLPTNLIPMEQLPETVELCQDTEQGVASNCMSAIAHLYQDPDARTRQKVGTDRLRSAMYYERCELCGNLWQSIPSTMVARDSRTTLDNRTVLSSTGKRPAEIERPFCPGGHGSMMMQVTPQQSLYWECSACSTTSGLNLGGCDVRPVDWESFDGVDANMVPIGRTRPHASGRAIK